MSYVDGRHNGTQANVEESKGASGNILSGLLGRKQKIQENVKMNKITIIGNLTADPDYAVTSGGTPVCKFTLAVNRRFKREGEAEADFFRVVTFNKSADNCATYLSKGRKAGVSGELHFGQYTDKEGIKRMTADLVADEVEFLSPKEDQPQRKPSGQKPANRTPLEPVTDDSLPF